MMTIKTAMLARRNLPLFIVNCKCNFAYLKTYTNLQDKPCVTFGIKGLTGFYAKSSIRMQNFEKQVL